MGNTRSNSQTITSSPTRAELDAALLAIATGDRAAFTRFYKATSPRVYAMLVRVTNDTEMAKDVLQQTFVKIWQNASRFDPAKGPALAWIFVMARNRAIDVLRSASAKYETDVIEETLEDQTAVADHLATALLLKRHLKAALSGLPAEMAQAVRLSAIYGFTSREIAAQLEIPHNTVKSWIRRGLGRMRKDLPWASVAEAI